jgi:cell pole-organizing protein PopZ
LKASCWTTNSSEMVTIANVAARTRTATQPTGTESRATARPTAGRTRNGRYPAPTPTWVKRIPIA